jgi:hypothetical protein
MAKLLSNTEAAALLVQQGHAQHGAAPAQEQGAAAPVATAPPFAVDSPTPDPEEARQERAHKQAQWRPVTYLPLGTPDARGLISRSKPLTLPGRYQS